MILTETEVKFVSMLAVGLGSFVIGIIPTCFIKRGHEIQQKLLLSSLLCFGAGVLLATSLLHMLPEIRESLPEYAELAYCGGFFLLYLVDETVQYFWGKDVSPSSETHMQNLRSRHMQDYKYEFSHVHSVNFNQNAHCQDRLHQHDDRQVNYNGITRNNAITSSKNVCPNQTCEVNIKNSIAHTNVNSTQYGTEQTIVPSTLNVVAPCCNNEDTSLCRASHVEPYANIGTGIIGLVIALSLHAVLEGLAIGFQKNVAEVLLLVGAVVSHKFVVGLCLGIELAKTASSILKHVIIMIIFSGGSSLGIGIGMLTFQVNDGWRAIVVAILQAFAGGTLLYVAVSEILPRERARCHKIIHRLAGIMQFLSVSCGFIIIFLLNKYIAE